MVKDLRYIIKRIIIGVGIALILMLIRGNFLIDVHAVEISSYTFGGLSTNIDNTTTDVSKDISGSPWANWRYGYLYFDFAIRKESGSSTSVIVVPRNVFAWSGSTGYICSFGSVSNNNSTSEGASYSVKCPMDLGSPGLTKISISFLPTPGSVQSVYAFNLTGYATYEQAPSTNVIMDISSINNNIQNQINNDNSNTQQIIESQAEINDSIDDVNNTLKDDSIDDDNVDGTLEDLQGQISSNGVITDLLLLPVTLYRAILNSINTSSSVACPNFSLGSLFNHTITLPCINLQNILGQNLYYIIDILCSGLMILAIRKKLVDIFNHMTSLNDRGNEIE